MALMRSQSSVLIKFLFITHCFSILCIAQGYDFFYFVQQWPGSYCDTKDSCCYPTTGKPASDFGIHGLWPNNNDGSYPSNCYSRNPYDESKISDLINRMQQDWPTLACPINGGSSFWSHEWEKRGTCSESVLNQHSYFETTLNLKNQIDLLQVLQSAGIQPDGSSYSLTSIKIAIQNAIGYTPWIECNNDADGNSQLYQISDLISRMQHDWPTLACPSNSGSSFWSHEWEKHGTCSESVLNQHSYFETTLNLKNQIDLLQVLQSAGIQPDGSSYSLTSIKIAIQNVIGYTPWIECNNDADGNSQLYQVYICVDSSASNLIKCPVFPTGSCASSIKFPSF